jgi:hypothetical protein
MLVITVKPRFALGQVVITSNALSTLTPEEINAGLQRHAKGDWGMLCPEDIASNDAALQLGGRLFSTYGEPGPKRFWIITECDRSVTTILMPRDY